MKRFQTILLMMVLIMGCGPSKHLPSQTTKVEVNVRDSLVIHRDTVTISIPVESSSTFQVQSSHLETTVAWSDARVDSSGLLTHVLTNKPTELKKEVIYLDRVKTEYRDSIQVKEIPVTVETIRKVIPNWCYGLLTVNLLVLLILGIRTYLKLRQP